MAWNAVASNPASMPSMWQPSYKPFDPYHSSSCDITQKGWSRWSTHVPAHPHDWSDSERLSSTRSLNVFDRRRTDTDWNSRTVDFIRQGHEKHRLWHWDRPYKPTQFQASSTPRDRTAPQPLQQGRIGDRVIPRTQTGDYSDIPTPAWGLYNPPCYEQPCRFKHGLPPI